MKIADLLRIALFCQKVLQPTELLYQLDSGIHSTFIERLGLCVVLLGSSPITKVSLKPSGFS